MCRRRRRLSRLGGARSRGRLPRRGGRPLPGGRRRRGGSLVRSRRRRLATTAVAIVTPVGEAPSGVEDTNV